MSAGKPLSPAEAMRAVAAEGAKDAIDEVTALPPEDVDAMLKAAGVDPAEAARRAQAAIEAALASVGGAAEPPPVSNVVALRKPASRAPSRRWLVVGTIAAAAAIAATVGGMNAGRIVEALRGGPAPIGTDPDTVPTPTPTRREPTVEERAAALRTKAFESCKIAEWDSCAQRLDDAQELDPAGEEQHDVIAARRAIANAHDDDGKKLK